MEYLYRALNRETSSGDLEAGIESPVAAFATVAPEISGSAESTQPAPEPAHIEIPDAPLPVNAGGSVLFQGNAIASSPTVRQSPERFYALSGEAMTNGRTLALEQIRVLRSRIMEFMRLRGMRTLLITSSVAAEGKTVTAINLALALSQVQRLRLLLVDVDLRKPNIASVLGLSSEKGLLTYLRSEVTLQQSVQRLNEQLSFIPAEKAHNSVELLHSSQMKKFMSTVRESYDLVILDSPPLYSIADAQILSSYVDGVMMCVRAGHTPMDVVSESAAMISGKLIGAVLVGGERQSQGYYSSYARYAEAEKGGK